ncbi:MAG TPA: signal recognition particle protein, partial [Candidatus Aenigmarchaeota archaeon]|nr:signal recognition particle protein [Candidatus Aenigmarchaeota archaeon]
MLENLGDSLKQAFRKIARIGVIDKTSVDIIVRDIQRALLQADVDVRLVVELSNSIKRKVLSEKPPSGFTLREYFTKVLYDEIVRFLGEERGELEIKPQRILLIGLFGSGKTSTAGKLARWFKSKGLNPALVACDTHRPAAKEQLKQLGEALGVRVYDEGKKPEDIARNAIKNAKEDVLIFDSAGRDALDGELAKELGRLGRIINPDEVLLVIPADIGQAARKQAEEFNRTVGITGIVVTKLDGTAKGGGALAAASVSGSKVKFITTGEKPEDLEVYDPKRFVGRLIGYGDLQGLLERARTAGIEANRDVAERIMSGRFTLMDFYEQIASIQKMGSLSRIMDMIPGLSMKVPKNMLDVQEDKMKRWRFAIDSMTREERENPDIIKASRIKRIARGAGISEGDVRELLRYFKQTQR